MAHPSLQLNEFASSSLIIFAALCKSIFTVLTQYIESVGSPWYQILFFTELIYFLLLVLFWVITYTRRYYITFRSTKGHVHLDDESQQLESQSQSQSQSQAQSQLTYFETLVSLFPRDKNVGCKAWGLLILRGVYGSGSFMFYVAALAYISSGDDVLIQTVIVTIGNVVFGIILFKESKSRLIIISLIICLIGLVFVCQPSFIFENINTSNNDNDNKESYTPISTIGFIFAILSGICRLGSGLTSKYAKVYNLNWLVLSLIAGFISVSNAGVVFLIEYYFLFGSSNKDGGGGYWNFDDNNAGYIAITFAIGLLICLFVACYTIAFQYGNVSRIGILFNTDIIFAYILQIPILNETENALTYVGVIIVLFVCIVVFVAQWKRSQESKQNRQLTSETSNSDQNEMAPIVNEHATSDETT